MNSHALFQQSQLANEDALRKSGESVQLLAANLLLRKWWLLFESVRPGKEFLDGTFCVLAGRRMQGRELKKTTFVLLDFLLLECAARRVCK